MSDRFLFDREQHGGVPTPRFLFPDGNDESQDAGVLLDRDGKIFPSQVPAGLSSGDSVAGGGGGSGGGGGDLDALHAIGVQARVTDAGSGHWEVSVIADGINGASPLQLWRSTLPPVSDSRVLQFDMSFLSNLTFQPVPDVIAFRNLANGVNGELFEMPNPETHDRPAIGDAYMGARPVLRHSSDDSFVTTGGNYNLLQNGSAALYWVGRNYSGGDNGNLLIRTDQMLFYPYDGNGSGGTGHIYIAGDSATTRLMCTWEDVPTDQYYVGCLILDVWNTDPDERAKLYFNGVQNTDFAASGAGDVLLDSATSCELFHGEGYTAEIILFNGTHDDLQRKAVENYLAAKWLGFAFGHEIAAGYATVVDEATGGSTVDDEARTALQSIRALLISRGLVAYP